MTYVIAKECVGHKDGSCVEVCPVDCIEPRPDDPRFTEVPHLNIDPARCIDCEACVSACPWGAVYAESDLPEGYAGWAVRNAAFFFTT